MMIPNFLYSNSFHFLNIIIIVVLIFIYYYYHALFLTAHWNCVRVVFVTNSNILLVYKKWKTIIFNNLRFFKLNFVF